MSLNLLKLHPLVALLSLVLITQVEGSSLSTSSAIAATMGTAIAIFLIIFIIYMCCKKRCKRKWSVHLYTIIRQTKSSLGYLSRKEVVVQSEGVENKGADLTDEKESEKILIVKTNTSSQTASPSTTEEAIQTETVEVVEDVKNVTVVKTVELVKSVEDVEDTKPVEVKEEIILQKTENVEESEQIEEPTVVRKQVMLTRADRTVSRDTITLTSGWRRSVKLMDLIKAKLINEKTVVQLETEEITISEIESQLKPYLIGLHPIAGVYNDQTGSKTSLFDAYKSKIISRGTALSLLEAQAATGSIINPINGDMMCVEDAQNVGLLDRSFAAVLSRAERAVTGYQVKGVTDKMSLFQAMQSGFIVEKHGIRLLEAQIATGGIIDPIANHRLPVEAAFERGLFDQRLNKILQDPGDDTKGFLDPNTGENLTYLELIERCIEDKDTKLLLLPLVKSEEKELYRERKLTAEILMKRLQSHDFSESNE